MSDDGEPWTVDRFWVTVDEALQAEMPPDLLIAAWRESDKMLGTNMADDLIREHLTARAG